MSNTASVLRRLNDVGFALEGASQTPKLIQLMKDAITVIQQLERQAQAAPPPPDQVLSREGRFAVMQQVFEETGTRTGLQDMEAIERAVLKQLGAKNV